MALGGVGEAALVVGTIVAIAGTAVSISAAKSTADFNAKIAGLDAARAREAARIKEDNIRLKNKRLLGVVRANTGSSGLLIEGSALEVLAENAAEGELEALTARFGGDLGSTRFLNEAELDRLAGDAAAVAGAGRIGSQLVSGVSAAGRLLGDTRRPAPAPEPAP